jgi:hypothetical protein
MVALEKGEGKMITYEKLFNELIENINTLERVIIRDGYDNERMLQLKWAYISKYRECATGVQETLAMTEYCRHLIEIIYARGIIYDRND